MTQRKISRKGPEQYSTKDAQSALHSSNWLSRGKDYYFRYSRNSIEKEEKAYESTVAPARGGKGGKGGGCPPMLKKMVLVILPNSMRKLGGGAYPSQM